jgi:hypothetical protein
MTYPRHDDANAGPFDMDEAAPLLLSDGRPAGSDPGDCRLCAPFACDDPDRHLGVPPEYAIPGCHCGAAEDGRDCMCFEGDS